MQELGKLNPKISVILNRLEKYMSFLSIISEVLLTAFNFLSFLNFLSSFLDSLVKNASKESRIWYEQIRSS